MKDERLWLEDEEVQAFRQVRHPPQNPIENHGEALTDGEREEPAESHEQGRFPHERRGDSAPPDAKRAKRRNLAHPLVHRDGQQRRDRKSTRLNSSHLGISYAVFCLKKKKTKNY